MKLELLSQCMGHSFLTTTAIYYKETAFPDTPFMAGSGYPVQHAYHGILEMALLIGNCNRIMSLNHAVAI
jgi:hypothetical protein